MLKNAGTIDNVKLYYVLALVDPGTKVGENGADSL